MHKSPRKSPRMFLPCSSGNHRHWPVFIGEMMVRILRPPQVVQRMRPAATVQTGRAFVISGCKINCRLII